MRCRAILTAVFVMVFTLEASACTGPTLDDVRAPRISGWLRPRGRTLVDQKGKIVRLLSVGISSMHRGSGFPDSVSKSRTGCPGWLVPDRYTFDNVERFGFNAVRLAISWANLEPTAPTAAVGGGVLHMYDAHYLSALDAVIRSFRERDIAVVLDMAQFEWSPAFREIPVGNGRVLCQGIGMPVWLYPDAASISPEQARCGFFADRPEPGSPLQDPQQGLVDVWRMLAARYADDPAVVAADMINEPFFGPSCAPADLNLDRIYARIGSAIRAASPHILLIFEESQTRGGTVFALRAPPPLAGAVYSFHLYTENWTPIGLQLTRAYLERAERWDVPLWIGEFNRFGPPMEPIPADWQTQLQQMLAFCRRNAIDWDYWAYTAPDAALVSDGHPNVQLIDTLQTGF